MASPSLLCGFLLSSHRGPCGEYMAASQQHWCHLIQSCHYQVSSKSQGQREAQAGLANLRRWLHKRFSRDGWLQTTRLSQHPTVPARASRATGRRHWSTQRHSRRPIFAEGVRVERGGEEGTHAPHHGRFRDARLLFPHSALALNHRCLVRWRR